MVLPACVVRPSQMFQNAAMCLVLGSTVQGPVSLLTSLHALHLQPCLFTAFGQSLLPCASTELLRKVELFWKLNTYPYVCIKDVTRSKHSML